MPSLSTEIWHRDDFPLLCILRCLDICIEVGVSIGYYSDVFMRRHYNLGYYLGIDPFEPYWEFPHDRSADKTMALSVYSKYIGKCGLAVCNGSVVAESIRKGEYGPIKNGSVGFVYIDAMHEYEPVKADIDMWWPLIQEGGILAGHDYDSTHPGVMRAVDEFERESGVTVYYTPDHPNSWYAYKNNKLTINWNRTLV